MFTQKKSSIAVRVEQRRKKEEMRLEKLWSIMKAVLVETKLESLSNECQDLNYVLKGLFCLCMKNSLEAVGQGRTVKGLVQ